MINIDHLLDQMTLEEKIGQMTQLSLDTLHTGEPMKIQLPPQLAEKKLDYIVRERMVGSILNVTSEYLPELEEWHQIISRIQAKTQETRLKIPVLYGIDAIHGVNYCAGATLFPQPLSIAASFNLQQAEAIARVTAYEAQAASMPWNFSPALDVGRIPSWPRFWESFGEDVFVNQAMGTATVKGYQGEAGDYTKVAACLKHFTGYGLPLSGIDRTPAWIPDRYLREYFLPAYQTAIDAGAMTIMVNSGEINGIPVHASKYLLTDILRKEMGFEGLLVTDWQDIIYLHTRHKTAPTMKDAVRISIEAGIDMSMTPFDTQFIDFLLELVQEGSISEERIDESVRRILAVKAHLGLFEQAVNNPKDYPAFGSETHQQLSLDAARESLVLLKNEQNLLPLDKAANILVCGPAADNQGALNGGWTASWQGDMAEEALSQFDTILEAIKRLHEGTLEYRIGVNYSEEVDFQEAIWKAQEADYIVLCLGEESYTEYCGDLNDLYLPDHQINLALALVSTGKPIILVLAEGRPRLISKFADQIPAIVGAFYPGPAGGQAIAELIFGDLNPSGKLPFTYPQFPNSLIPYDHKFTEVEGVDDTIRFNPQFEFGHGLSYTQFEYSNLQLNKKSYTPEETIHVSIAIKNTGSKAGKETVLLYVRDEYASITPPVKRLRKFKKLALESGAEQTIHFEIQPSELAFVGLDNQWILEAGRFELMIDGLSQYFIIE
ncbi:MAG: glycoside hydrolase family 3 N-terminal domain-containing protein [Saprospiraceae bacterium]